LFDFGKFFFYIFKKILNQGFKGQKGAFWLSQKALHGAIAAN